MASENLVGDSEIMVGLDRSKPFWWRRLTDCDPISLEPLRRLRVEPFELTADGQVCDAQKQLVCPSGASPTCP